LLVSLHRVIYRDVMVLSLDGRYTAPRNVT